MFPSYQYSLHSDITKYSEVIYLENKTDDNASMCFQFIPKSNSSDSEYETICFDIDDLIEACSDINYSIDELTNFPNVAKSRIALSRLIYRDFEMELINKMYMFSRALKHSLRQRIIKEITRRESMTVTQLWIALRIEQSVCSQHLKILRDTGIVQVDKSGKEHYYTINEKKINQVTQSLQNAFKEGPSVR